MKRYSRGLLAALGVAVLVLTSACGGSQQPKAQDTITFAVSHPLGELNPRVMAGDFPGQDLIFEPLMRYGKNGELQPALATSWAVAPDGLSATFQLRPNVKFTDGTPFDAEAAKWNFDQWIGKPEYLSVGSSQRITSVDVVSDHEIKLNLREPYSALLQELTLVRPVRFASPKSVDASGKYIGPIGTGPYAIGRNDNQGASFTPNAEYWGGKPKFREVDMKIIDDSASRALALRSGEVDVIGGDWLSPISPVEADQLKGANGVKLVTGPGFNTLLLGFNFQNGPASDPAVRQAIGESLDTKVFSDVYFRGYAAPASALYPSTVTNAPKEASGTFDVAAANAALEATGWAGGPSGRSKGGAPLKLNMLVSDAVFPGARLLSQQVQASLKQIGVAVDIATVDATTYADRISRGDYDLAFYQTYGAPYDPLSTLTFMFNTQGDRSDGRVYQSPAVDAGILTAQDATTPEAASAAYAKIYQELSAASAFVPLVWPSRIWAAGKSVSDLTLAPTEYGLPLQMLVAG